MKKVIIVLASLLIVSIAETSMAAPTCQMNSTNGKLLVGLLLYSDFDKYNQMIQDEDFIAASNFVLGNDNRYATIFRRDEPVYVKPDDYLPDAITVRRPGETTLWVTFSDVVKCTESK